MRLAEVTDVGFRPLDLTQDRARMFVKPVAGRCADDAARRAPEQGGAERLLQIGDVLAQRRLGDAEIPRRAGKAARLDDLQEISELVDFYDPPPSRPPLSDPRSPGIRRPDFRPRTRLVIRNAYKTHTNIVFP